MNLTSGALLYIPAEFLMAQFARGQTAMKGNIMTIYTLPDLPYDYNALEPYISGKIIELHHAKHHAGYVKNANSVLEQLDEARQKEDFAFISALERALAVNLSGFILHSILWKNM